MDITIKAEYTGSEEKIKFFAKAKGWRETIEERNDDGEKIEIPNPITLKEFVYSFTIKLLTDQISGPAIQSARNESQKTLQETNKLIKADIESGLNIEVV